MIPRLQFLALVDLVFVSFGCQTSPFLNPLKGIGKLSMLVRQSPHGKAKFRMGEFLIF